MLHVLIDTSTWLDLAKRRDGQRLIVPLRVFMDDGRLELLVPQVVIDEFDRNRPNVESSMTRSVTERFKAMGQELHAYGYQDHHETIDVIDQWARDVPLIGAMTTRNFDDIRQLLDQGTRIEPTTAERHRVVERGLTKTAPFHRNRNSVADALLIELYATASMSAKPDDQYGFVTSNSDDFSSVSGDTRQPHDDLAGLFAAPHSRYRLGVPGLEQAMRDGFGEDAEFMMDETHVSEEPRRLDEILAAEDDLSDKVWYHGKLVQEKKLIDDGDSAELERIRGLAGPAKGRIEEAYGADSLDPYSDFEWGMLNGKLSAIRWVLGSEWDFLDT